MSIPKSQLSLTDLMTPLPFTIGCDATLATARFFLKEHSIHHLPVLEQGKLVGLLNDRVVDIACTFDSAATLCVRDVMNSHPIVVREDVQILEALQNMIEGREDSILVTHAKSGNIIGVFTWRDGIRLLMKLLG